MIGTTLGHYRIQRLLGQGGMGDVYAAEDLTLGRTVAIKVLPAGLAAMPADHDRFEREAKAVAALNHRAIVTLYSFENADGVRFITMELVDGQPLSARIGSTGMPFDELLRVGAEIADAVAAAHERGIIHRDLKPANVLVTPTGGVKVLDFGLAKLREPDVAPTELPTQQLTGEGKIVGTVAYMSPEQAEGKPVDHRTDIFSLGAMLYEMATGQRPFQGDTSLSVLSAVLKDTPRSASDLNPSVPASFARVLRTCLQKDPDRRYQSAKDLRNELRTLKEELDSGELSRPTPAAAPAATARNGFRWPILAVIAGLVGLTVLAVALWPRGGASPATPIGLQFTQLTSAPGVEAQPTVSPDGKWVAYVSGASGNADIYLQSVGGQNAINLTKESPGQDTFPVFSPDGERIAFRSDRDSGGLFVMGRTGEAPRHVTPDGAESSWSPDGSRLVYSTAAADVPTDRSALSSLRIVRLDSGAVTTLLESDGMSPAWSPNGKFIAYWTHTSAPGKGAAVGNRDVWIIPADGGTPWKVTNDEDVDWCPAWSSDGSFLYFVSNRGGSMNLWRLPMNAGTGKPTGPPQAATTPAGYVGRIQMAAGSIAFENRNSTSNISRASFDETKAGIGPLETVTSGSRAFRFVDPSPDGRSLVLGTGFLQVEDLFIGDADGSNLRQLTTDAFNDRYPKWSPDGQSIAFYSNRSGKYEIWTTTPSGLLKQITDAKDYTALYPRWSPDGTRMTFSDVSGRRAVVMFDPRKAWSEQTPEVLPAPAGPGSYLQGRLQWSPDSKKLAGNVNGAVAVYDVDTRQYRTLAGIQGAVFAWLKDGRLLVGPATAPRLVDPNTGAAKVMSVPDFGGETPGEMVLSHDERTVYLSRNRNEIDIWLARISSK